MAWRLRTNNEPAPRYIKGNGLFTIKIHHKGNFGTGGEYVGGIVTNIDYVDIDNFSMKQLNLMVRALGYTRVENFTVFFRIPTLSMKYGVVVVEIEDDIKAVSFQAREFPEISLYFRRKHDSTVNSYHLFGQRRIPRQHRQRDTIPPSSDANDIDEDYLSDARSYIII